MKTVVEMVKERLDEKRTKEAQERNDLVTYRQERDKKKAVLEEEINITLTEVAEQLGLKRDGNKIQIGGWNWFEVYTELVYGKTRPADDCDEVPYECWVVRWRNIRDCNEVHGGHCDVKSFREGFAQFVAGML